MIEYHSNVKNRPTITRLRLIFCASVRYFNVLIVAKKQLYAKQVFNLHNILNWHIFLQCNKQMYFCIFIENTFALSNGLYYLVSSYHEKFPSINVLDNLIINAISALRAIPFF